MSPVSKLPAAGPRGREGEVIPGGGCLDGRWEVGEEPSAQSLPHRSDIRPLFGEHRQGRLERCGQE